MAKKHDIEIGIGFKVDKTGLDSLKSQLQSIQNMRVSDMVRIDGKDAIGELRKIKETASTVENALNKAFNYKINNLNLRDFQQELSKSGITLDTVYNDFSKLGANGRAAFRNLTMSALTTNQQLRTTSSIVDKMGQTFINSAKWFVASSVINSFSRSVQGAWGYVKALDESLNDIRIVTGKNADEMERFAVEANKAAQSFGKTTTDYTKASLIYYQQGLGDKEVRERTDVTMKLSGVTGQSAQEVSDYMTAIWNNFDDGSESLEHYADVITALGATTASSSKEIAAGLQKFAAVADTVGLSYEYATSALATVVAATRQSADTVGTAFKTLFARIESLKLGETLDDGISLNKYAQALEKIGVYVLEGNDELRSMDEILYDLGDRWKDLTEAQKVATAQTVAGVRQYTQLIALLDNWDSFNKNLQTANQAEGSLQAQQERYMDSLEAHLNQLKAAGEGVIQSFTDADSFKAIINAGTGLLKVLNNIIKAIGGGGNALLGLGAILTRVFSKQISGEINNIVLGIQAIGQRAEALRVKRENFQIAASEMGAREKDPYYNDLMNQYGRLEKNFGVMNFDQIKEGEQMLLDMAAAMAQVDKAGQQLATNNFYAKAFTGVKTASEVFEDSAKIDKFNESIKNSLNTISRSQNEINNFKGKIKELLAAYNEAGGQKDGKKVFFRNFIPEETKQNMTDFIARLKEFKKELPKDQDSVPVQNLGIAIKQVEQALKTGSKETIENSWRSLSQALNSVKTEVQGVGESVEKTTVDFENSSRKLDALKGQYSSWIATFDSQTFIRGVSNTLSAVTTLAFVAQQIHGIIDTLNNDSLSTGEKFITVAGQIGLVGGSIISVLPRLTEGLGWMAAGLSGASANSLTLVESLTILLPYVGVAAAIAGAIYGIANALDKTHQTSKEKTADILQHAEDMRDVAASAKAEYEGIKDSLSEYDSLVAALDSCDSSTEAWAEHLRDVNNYVIKLMEDYPELLENGAIQWDSEKGAYFLDPEKRKEWENKKRLDAAAAEIASYSADIYAIEHQIEDQEAEIHTIVQRLKENNSDGLFLTNEDFDILEKQLINYAKEGKIVSAEVVRNFVKDTVENRGAESYAKRGREYAEILSFEDPNFKEVLSRDSFKKYRENYEETYKKYYRDENERLRKMVEDFYLQSIYPNFKKLSTPLHIDTSNDEIFAEIYEKYVLGGLQEGTNAFTNAIEIITQSMLDAAPAFNTISDFSKDLAPKNNALQGFIVTQTLDQINAPDEVKNVAAQEFQRMRNQVFQDMSTGFNEAYRYYARSEDTFNELTYRYFTLGDLYNGKYKDINLKDMVDYYSSITDNTNVKINDIGGGVFKEHLRRGENDQLQIYLDFTDTETQETTSRWTNLDELIDVYAGQWAITNDLANLVIEKTLEMGDAIGAAYSNATEINDNEKSSKQTDQFVTGLLSFLNGAAYDKFTNLSQENIEILKGIARQENREQAVEGIKTLFGGEAYQDTIFDALKVADWYAVLDTVIEALSDYDAYIEEKMPSENSEVGKGVKASSTEDTTAQQAASQAAAWATIYSEAGKEAYQATLDLFQLEGLDLSAEGTTELLNLIASGQATTESLIKAVQEGGALVDPELTKAINTLIQLMGSTEGAESFTQAETAAGNLDKIIGKGLQEGAIYTAEEAQALIESIGSEYASFLTYMGNGTYKLTGDAELFYKTVQEHSIEGYRNTLNTLQEEQKKLEAMSSKLFNDNGSITSNRSPYADIEGGIIPLQIELLKKYGTEEMQFVAGAARDNYGKTGKYTDKDLDDLQTMTEKLLTEQPELIKNNLAEIARFIAQSLQAINNISYQNITSLRELQKERSKLQETGEFDQDIYNQTLIGMGMQYDDAIDEAEELDRVLRIVGDDYKDNAEEAARVAAATENLEQALRQAGWREVSKTLADYKKNVEEAKKAEEEYGEGTEELTKALDGVLKARKELQKAFEEKLGLHLDFKDIENLDQDLLDTWTNGTKEESLDASVRLNLQGQVLSEEFENNIIELGVEIDEAGLDQLQTDLNEIIAMNPDIVINASTGEVNLDPLAIKLIDLGYNAEYVAGILRGLINTDIDFSELQSQVEALENLINGMSAVDAGDYPGAANLLASASGALSEAHIKGNAPAVPYEMASTDGKKGGGGGGGSKKDPKKEGEKLLEDITKKEDDLDKYREYTHIIDEASRAVDRLAKAQEKLRGDKLIANLKEQTQLLEKQIDAYKKKLQFAQEEMRTEQEALSAEYQAEFDETGYLTNYNDILLGKLASIKELINQYMESGSEELKEQIDEEKEAYDKIKEALDEYDEDWNIAEELKDSIEEAMNEQIQKQIEAFKVDIEIKLDTHQAKLDWIEFESKVIKDLEDDDFVGIAEQNLKKLYTYMGKDGIVGQLKKQVSETMDQLSMIREGGIADIYGDDEATAFEDASNYLSTLMTKLTEAADVVREIRQNYLDLIDHIKELWDEQTDQLETANKLLQDNLKISQLLGGTAESISKNYDQQNQILNYQVEYLSKEAAMWERLMDTEYELMKNGEKGAEQAWKKYREIWEDAAAAAREAFLDQMDLIKQSAEDTIEQIAKDLQQNFFGMSIDLVSKQWDRMKELSDKYFDSIQRIFNMDNLRDAFDDALAEFETNPRAQKQINNLLQQTIEFLEAKDKLTEIDIQRAEKRLALLQAEITLQNVQDSKNEMRLRRNSQGDYVYEYVANRNEIEQAQDNLMKAREEFYEFEREQAQKTVDDIISLFTSLSDDMVELTEQATEGIITAEEKAMRENMIGDYYLPEVFERYNDYMEIYANLQRYGAELFPDLDPNTYLPSLPEGMEKSLKDYITDPREFMKNISSYLGLMQQALGQQEERTAAAIENASAAGLDIQSIINGVDTMPSKIVSSIIDVDKMEQTSEMQLTYVRDIRGIANEIMKKISSTGVSLFDTWTELYDTEPYIIPKDTKKRMDEYAKLAAEDPYLNRMAQGAYEIATTGDIFTYDTQKYIDEQNAFMNTLSEIFSDEMQMLYASIYSGLYGVLQDAGIAGVINTISKSQGETNNIIQEVNINANFPNVERAQEIQQAFDNLINITAQRLAIKQS